MSRFILVLVTLTASLSAHGVCSRSFFDNTTYHISVNPINDLGDVPTAGRMEFITGFNRAGFMPRGKLLWAQDVYEGTGTTVFVGGANKDKTRLFSRRNKRNCFVSINMAGTSTSNGFSWTLAASGFASLASVSSEAPDIISLSNAVVTYAGYEEWADVIVTRLQ